MGCRRPGKEPTAFAGRGSSAGPAGCVKPEGRAWRAEGQLLSHGLADAGAVQGHRPGSSLTLDDTGLHVYFDHVRPLLFHTWGNILTPAT